MRAGVAALAVSFFGGWLGTQYVGDRFFSLLVPALVGLAVAGAARTASGLAATRGPASIRVAVLAVAVVGALVSVGLAFRLVPGAAHPSPFLSLGQALPPYLCSVVGVLLWPLVAGPGPGTAQRVSPRA